MARLFNGTSSDYIQFASIPPANTLANFTAMAVIRITADVTTERMLLTLQWCNDCERAIHFPREACPTCLGTDLEYRPAAGSGTVYAATVIPAPANPTMADRAPYVVALVDLPEGVRMMGNVIAEDPWAVAVGDPVRIAWEPLPDGRHLPVWVPAG